MQTYLKTKPVWVQLMLFVGMALGILTAVFMAGSLFLSGITGIPVMEMSNTASWDFKDPDTVLLLRGMMLLQFIGLFLLPSLLFAYFSDPHPLPYIGLKKGAQHGYWIVGILAMMLAIPLVEYLGLLNRQLPFNASTRVWIESMETEAARTLQALLGRQTAKDLMLNLIFIALFAGIGEELFFRGIIQRLLIRSTGSPWSGIIITALIFSFFHFQFYGFLPRFVLGILLGAVYWYSGSLWTAILAHFLYDAVFIVVLYFYPQFTDSNASLINPAKLPMMALGSAVLVAACVWWMKKKSSISYDAVYADEIAYSSINNPGL